MGRYRIIIWRFFTLALAWSVVQNSEGTLVYRYNEGPDQWQSAQANCVSSGGNLVNGSTEYQLMNCTSFPKNEHFWIGMYSMFTPWIQIVGCFQLNTSLITSQFYTQDAIECSKNCITHFGLMGETCFCLSDGWTIDDNIQVPDSLCPIKCKGNEQDSCGGNNYTTVYNTVQDSDITDRDDETVKDDIMCGLVECTNSGWEYFGYACNQSLPAFCNDMNKTTENKHWEAGQEECWNNYNSFLIGATIQKVTCLPNSTSKAPSWIGLYRRKITTTVHGNSSITTSSCFNGALVDGVLEKDSNISCDTKLPFVCQLETDTVLDNDCVVFPSKELLELSSSDMQATTSMETTDKPSITTKKSAVTSNEENIVLTISVFVLLGMVLVVVVGTVMCHCICGQRPPGQEIREDNCDDTGNVRYDDFYVSHNSDNVSDISPQYSLFEENTDDVTDEVDAPIVLYGQHIDGRVSTFVHTRKPTGENNVLYINDHDNNTPL